MGTNIEAEMGIRHAAGIFKALGHPERLRIVARLAEGAPRTQHELLAELPWAQSTLARHVAVLRERGIVKATRHGNEVQLRLVDDLAPRLLDVITTRRAVDDAATAAGGVSR